MKHLSTKSVVRLSVPQRLWPGATGCLMILALHAATLANQSAWAGEKSSKQSLVRDDLPEAERVKVLAKWFDPPPGSPAQIDPLAIRDRTKDIDVLKLEGRIVVRPPKGHCLTITRRADLRDLKVCRETAVSFRIEDIHETGTLWWRVATGPDDFGTRLSWPTPHRVAWIIKAEAPMPSEPEPVVIERCELGSRDEWTRRIQLRPLDTNKWGPWWMITLPIPDRMMPQPEDQPNLFVTKQNVNTVITKGGGKDAPSPSPSSSPTPSPAPSPGSAATPGPSPTPTSVATASSAEASQPAPMTWRISPKGTYVMNAANFMPAGPVPPGMQGQCRYQFHATKDEPSGGRIECHGADQFAWVYVPLACIELLQPIHSKP